MGRKTWFTAAAAAFGASVALLSAPAQAIDAVVSVQIAPPAPRYEVIPVARRGHVWVQGHWQWNGHRHVWVPGRYVVARSGYYYEQPQWIQVGSSWDYRPGGWHRGHRRDSDHDGIPNRYDHDRDNDGRPDWRDRDRDGDGVPNRYDRRPDNRYRN